MPDFNTYSQEEIDLHFMQLALEQAQIAEKLGEVPVGAVVTHNNIIISYGYNKKESTPLAIHHAEIIAIEKASKKLKRWRLSNCTLYVTLEPCLMCTGALIASRVDRLVYATHDPKAGAITSVFNLSNHPKLNHSFEFTFGPLKNECSLLLKNFFKDKRVKLKKSNK